MNCSTVGSSGEIRLWMRNCFCGAQELNRQIVTDQSAILALSSGLQFGETDLPRGSEIPLKSLSFH